MDLLAEFKSRRWRRLLNLIDHLPRNSFFAEAMAQDEEAAAAWLAHQEAAGETEAPEPVERWSEWSPERDAMERVADAINALIATTVSAHGGKAPALRPGARPVTALDKVRRDQRIARDRALKARLGVLPPAALPAASFEG